MDGNGNGGKWKWKWKWTWKEKRKWEREEKWVLKREQGRRRKFTVVFTNKALSLKANPSIPQTPFEKEDQREQFQSFSLLVHQLRKFEEQGELEEELMLLALELLLRCLESPEVDYPLLDGRILFFYKACLFIIQKQFEDELWLLDDFASIVESEAEHLRVAEEEILTRFVSFETNIDRPTLNKLILWLEHIHHLYF